MTDDTTTPHTYSKQYFQQDFPPNHNPIIGALQADTLNNVHDCLSTLQMLTVAQESLQLSTSSTTGLYYFMACLVDALAFETEHRE